MGSRSAKLELGLALIVVMFACSATGVAQANELTVFSCHDPTGEAVGHDGWVNARTADGDMYATDGCAGKGQGSLSLELGANGGGYPNAAETEWVFQAPAWASIASYTLSLGGSYAIPSTGGGSGQAFVIASDEGDPNYDYRNLGAASQGPWTISRKPPAPVQSLTLNASCDGQDGPCPGGTRISALYLTAASILLRDPTSPTVGSLSGNLLPGSSVRGSGEADFSASDPGPGIYSALLSVDGEAQAPVLLDSNGGWCEDLGQSSDGTRSFAHADPCAQSLSGAVSFDTSALADGEHAMRLSVDDASGNATTAFNGAITTHNAPVNSTPPTITGAGEVGVGSVLSASTGSWATPAGAGSTSYGYQWQDCDAHGSECEQIAGAQSNAYATTSADAGHTVRVSVSASDRDGVASTASPATTSVMAPSAPGGGVVGLAAGTPNGRGASEQSSIRLNGAASLTRGYSRSALSLSGSLTGAQGQPIAGGLLDVVESSAGRQRVIGHATTAAGGTFTARAAAGPSRTVVVAYRAFSGDLGYAASANVRESVTATVGLSVTPRRTRPSGTIALSGRVLGGVPRSGVIVELLVRYRGSWEPFRTPRTDARGRFRVLYQFQGATGSFPFRAEVPGGQASFPYRGGVSATVTVRST